MECKNNVEKSTLIKKKKKHLIAEKINIKLKKNTKPYRKRRDTSSLVKWGVNYRYMEESIQYCYDLPLQSVIDTKTERKQKLSYPKTTLYIVEDLDLLE